MTYVVEPRRHVLPTPVRAKGFWWQRMPGPTRHPCHSSRAYQKSLCHSIRTSKNNGRMSEGSSGSRPHEDQGRTAIRWPRRWCYYAVYPRPGQGNLRCFWPSQGGAGPRSALPRQRRQVALRLPAGLGPRIPFAGPDTGRYNRDHQRTPSNEGRGSVLLRLGVCRAGP